MRITNLKFEKSTIYSSNAFLVLGDWSVISDVNTLIDTGSDPKIMAGISAAPTGVGKRSVEQVILTHSHSDHVSLLPIIREKYHPVVYAFTAFSGVDHVLQNGQNLLCGDRFFEVIHCPGHSNDSVCLYCKTDGVLFVGDTSVIIRTSDDTYEDGFVAALEHLCTLSVSSIYFGHDNPLTNGAQAALNESLRNVRVSRDRKRL